MNIRSLCAVMLLAGWMAACSQGDEPGTTHLEGQITVADTLGGSGDYSGTEITVLGKNEVDTLYHAVTDSLGNFSGESLVPEQDIYTLILNRNGQELGRMPLMLAADDTVRITSSQNDEQETIEIESREYNAMELYNRLNRNFQRLSLFASAGEISGDSLMTEVAKWGDLYWEVYERHENTIAGKLAAGQSIRLLEANDREKMMGRLKELREKDELVGLAATHGKNYLAQEKGLDYTLAYMDTLQDLTDEREALKQIRMERIQLLYDSARTEIARTRLTEFQNEFENDSTAIAWAEDIQYDLDFLSPGDSVPDFAFTDNGSEISRESMMGKPYLLEITSMVSGMYREQFDRMVVIHSIYKNYGLGVVTLPVDENSSTIENFFEQRVKPWPVASHGSFDSARLLETFNIRLVPTRFLVDRNGLIVRKYVGNEFQEVIPGIRSVIESEEQEL